MPDHDPRNVLVTGGAAGIGLAIAQRFARKGASVGLLDRSRAQLDAALAAFPADARVDALHADIGRRDEVEDAIATFTGRRGSLDVAVSNAGVAPNHLFLEMDDDQWQSVIGTNLTGAFVFMQTAARVLVGQGRGGKICAISSGARQSARTGAAAYCASKAGLVMLAKVMALELGPHGINVNVVSPGFIDHGTRPGLGAFTNDEYVAAMKTLVPLPRMGVADDIAAGVEYLCSPDADWVTGTVLDVDGGSSTGRAALPRN
ncbi:SDR family NAD(P)-dependent oxidoreductase [Actinomadura scrupuli]|uniref:SDR family NAD(P)-dependent oxidoreductase n=1 Tax=Actinomadura scrupuli TaxID=559629 RepID=UPI003D999F60